MSLGPASGLLPGPAVPGVVLVWLPGEEVLMPGFIWFIYSLYNRVIHDTGHSLSNQVLREIFRCPVYVYKGPGT